MVNSMNRISDSVRLVLFATEETPPDIPDVGLACLLPLGAATFIERTMDSLALAGVKQIDVVIGNYPESVRGVLRDGDPWGIAIKWHHAKDSLFPYAVLRAFQLVENERLVIGHAHNWVNSRILKKLIADNAAAVHIDSAIQWAGWCSDAASKVTDAADQADYATLKQRVCKTDGVECVVANAEEFALADSAFNLMLSQQHALDGTQETAFPASWIKTSWGAASPDASIHVNAQIEGPVLVGPRCLVEEGAYIGAGSVLTKDVFVAQGAHISHSLVMPNTYISGQISLENMIASGNSIQSLKWNVRSVMDPKDAMIAQLKSTDIPKTSLFSRFTALIALVAMSPVFFLLVIWQWIVTKSFLWCTKPMVKARLHDSQSLQMVTLRMPHTGHLEFSWVSAYGGLLDIFQGRRAWFGIRPRTEEEWNHLALDWQNLFSRSVIGVFYAPAWREGAECASHESNAVADAFMAVQKSFFAKMKIALTGRY
jgi:hypothetical protein